MTIKTNIRTIRDVIHIMSADLLIIDPIPIYVALGALIANYLPGDPVWLLIVGPPSSGKTEIINALTDLADVHDVSTFTPAALLSGSISKNNEQSGGLLRQFRKDDQHGTFGILVFKDFTSIISESHDTRSVLLSALRLIYDGTWVRHLGVEGGRKLAWAGKAGLLGAVTETIDRQAAVMGAMGERFILVRMPELDNDQRTGQARRALANTGNEKTMRRDHAAAVTGLLAHVDLTTPRPTSPLDLAQLADFATRARSTVETGLGGTIELVPQPEAAGRMARVLAQLDYGMAIGGLTPDQRAAALLRTVLDSIPKHRLQIIRELAAHPTAGWTATTLASATGLMDPAAVERHLFALAAHEVLERQSGGPAAATWRPTPWLMSYTSQVTQ